MQVEIKLNVFLFFFHLKNFRSLLCSTLFSFSLSSRHKSTHQRCSIVKTVLKNLQHSQGNTLCWSYFIIKFQVWRPATLSKRESKRDVFLWILGYFKEELVWRTSANDSYFCHLRKSIDKMMLHTERSFLVLKFQEFF